jgi:hypothetical protein
MADENTLRTFRVNDPHRREAAAGGRDHAGHDPLAELARLIGQSDPFADFQQATPQSAASREPHADRQQAADAINWRPSAPPPFPPQTVPRHHYPDVSADSLPADPAYGQAEYEEDYRNDPHDAVAADRYESMYAGTNYAAAPDTTHGAYYEDDAPMGPEDEAMYDDAPNTRRSGGILTVATLIVCAMIGTAGAYGYRTYYVGAGSSTPPIIVADKTPAKVVPPVKSQSSKTIQDRLGGQSGPERVVSHEEQPMQLPSTGSASSPRVVLPPPVTPMPTAAAAFPPPPPTDETPQASDPTSSRAFDGSEAKRVRTVTIRPDGGDPASQPTGAHPAPAPRAAATPSHSSPLSLNPGAEAPTHAAPARVASAPSNSQVAPSNARSGGYVVQISSQRSEADAHAAFRTLQAKYRSVLGDQQAIVRRADLGARGTYYRTMVGPFASVGEAGQLCKELKAAGGQCIIVRN